MTLRTGLTEIILEHWLAVKSDSEMENPIYSWYIIGTLHVLLF